MNTWIPEPAQSFIAANTRRIAAMSLAELDAEVHRLVAAHEQLVDHECVNLYAGTNVMNPRAAKLLASSIGSRPSLGHPGDKYNKGMVYAEQIELITAQLFRQLFHADFIEYRAPSGSIANLFAFMAVCKPGDLIFSFSDSAAGHPTHHANGAAGLYGLRVQNVPFDEARMDVDADALARLARQEKPKLIIVAGSMCLFPYSVAKVRAIADEIGAVVMYDAAHMSGMMAGGEFQQPLAEGAHLMTSSTYKSLGGPPSGFIATSDPALAERLDAIAYPGLTANFDLSKTAAMAIALMDLREHGPAYARACIANAQALAQAMHQRGLDVHYVSGRGGFTASQHVALRANTYGGGNAACKVLERANLLMTSIGLPGEQVAGDANAIRIGTQEVTRQGMTPDAMRQIADFVGRVLVVGEPPEQVRPEVVRFRAGYQTLAFIR